MPIEFQYEPDPEMFGRLLVFLGSLWQQVRPDALRGSRYQLAAAVINLTGTPSSLPASQDYALPGPDGLRCCLQVRELHLQTMPAAPLLERIRRGELSRALLVWIPMMFTDDASSIIAQWVELASAEPDERLSAEYAALAKVFARLSPAAEQWFQVLEGWNMKTSPFLEEVRAEGRTQGRTEGLAQGILRSFRLRFRIDPPAEIRARVEAERNLDRINRWFDAAVTANSLKHFAAFNKNKILTPGREIPSEGFDQSGLPMSNKLRKVSAEVRKLSVAEAEVLILVEAEAVTPTTEVRGRMVGPRCPGMTTIEVPYPLREFAHPPEAVPSLSRRVVIPDPTFWDEKRPYVYRVYVELWQDGQRVDRQEFDCGLRLAKKGS